MKTLAVLMFAAASLCLLGCPEKSASDSAKPAATTSAAAPGAAPPAAAPPAKPAATGGW